MFHQAKKLMIKDSPEVHWVADKQLGDENVCLM